MDRNLIVVWGSKFSWSQWWDLNYPVSCVLARNWLSFNVGIEIELVFVRVSTLTFFVCVEKYLVLVYGSKLAWFWCAGRKRLVFSVGIDWLSCYAGGRNWLGFCMLAEYHLILVWASNLTSFLYLWSKLTCFHCGGRNLTWFHCRDRNWLGFDVGVEND